ncbi:MlaD family protein [Segniliparus rugosus]|uniref:Virulence factor Mce family protein n=1 Tax=Segniliparus rugosus (strain ATCC BAA-974 / DSM 45345 / CCUG 50838 / CIP 108380 / JCM 13579 / CDC 945) TaxID=679197 RepID=E5XS63_SEGRC|nr:MlaD family protein [Segniliparus rugosus]EFV12848.1 virulence factor Mce family protein [Segniliparus rugosus ATCC BAA-974]
MRSFRNAFIMVLAVAVVLSLGFGGNWLYHKKLFPTRTICATFRDGFGLYPGNNVSLLGVDVGKVVSVEPQDDVVKVLFEVPKDLDLPADVKAITNGASVVTDMRVELTKGYKDGPKFTGEHCLEAKNGDTKTPVPPSETLETLTNFADGLTGNADPNQPVGQIATLLRRVQESISGKGPEINEVFRKSMRLFNTDVFPEPLLVDLIENTDLLLRELNTTSKMDLLTVQDNIQGLVDFLTDFQITFSKAIYADAQLITSLSYSVIRLEPMLGRLLQLLMPALHRTLSALNDSIDILEQIPTLLNNWQAVLDPRIDPGAQSFGPVTLDLAVTAAKGTCEWVNTFSPRIAPVCPFDMGMGTTIDWGLVRLVLGEGGWR